MQTRSFSKAFRKTILRLWWTPFLFAAIAGPVVYTMHEINSGGFTTTGKIFLDVSDERPLEESVIQQHELMIKSAVLQDKAEDILAQEHAGPMFMEASIDVLHDKDTGIIKVTCSGEHPEFVRDLLQLQFQLYLDAIDSHRSNATPEAGALDLAHVTPRVLETPGLGVEDARSGSIPRALLASLMGAFAGIALMLVISGIWAFFRPARIQPSLDEIMKAAEGLDASGRVALLERVTLLERAMLLERIALLERMLGERGGE